MVHPLPAATQCNYIFRWFPGNNNLHFLHTNTYIRCHCSEVGSLDQTVMATGLEEKPRRLNLLIVSADEDQRRLQRAVYGEWFHSWGGGSSGDLVWAWKWPLTFRNYTDHTITPDLAWVNLDRLFSFFYPQSQAMEFLALPCWSHLLSEITMLPLLSLFLQISNSSDSECTPKLFVISSKVRTVYETGSFSLHTLHIQSKWGAGEKLLNVGPLLLFDSGDKSHSHLWKMGYICWKLKCAVQLPLTFMLHVKAICTCGMQNYNKHILVPAVQK